MFASLPGACRRASQTLCLGRADDRRDRMMRVAEREAGPHEVVGESVAVEYPFRAASSIRSFRTAIVGII